MVAYKKNFPKETDAEFSKIESRDLHNPKTKSWPVLIFFQFTPFLQLY